MMAIDKATAAENAQKPGEQRASVLEWSPAPSAKATFAGVDYSVNAAADGLDPYLVWADLSGFAHLRKPGQRLEEYRPTSIPLLIELQNKVSAQDLLAFINPVDLKQDNAYAAKTPQLTISGAYLQEGAAVPGGVVPANANSAFFQQISRQSLAKYVRRIEIDLPQDATLKLPKLEKSPQPAQNRPLLKGKVMALIDDGCAFAHPHFLRNAAAPFETRIARLWDMNVRGAASPVGPPSLFAVETYPGEHGCDYADTDLNALMAQHTHAGRLDEDGVYAALAAHTWGNVNRLQLRAAHGTHVMDLACGPYFVQDTMCTRHAAEPANPTWEQGQDAASDVQIIFVQLPMRTVQDTSGRNTMTRDVTNALTYIMAQCAVDAQIVVNLSWGALAGPHDGSHVLERYIDTLIRFENTYHRLPAPGKRLQVVVPAGNGYQSRTHANFSLTGFASQTLYWRTEPDDATESYVEIWLRKGDEVAVDIVDPNGNSLPTVRKGDVRHLLGYNTPLAPGSVLGVCYNDAALSGQNGHCVLLALAPTASLDRTRATAPHGLWRITVTNVKAKTTVVDAYIERDDVALGTRRGARQSYFEDVHYDRMATNDNEQADINCPTPQAAYVRREGVFNNISTGKRTHKAGGVRETDMEIAEYSPRHNYTSRPKRPGTKTPVPYYATTEESRSLRGVRAAGTRAASTARLSGTSMAAPQIARDLLNALLP